jgi:hypothetical protein
MALSMLHAREVSLADQHIHRISTLLNQIHRGSNRMLHRREPHAAMTA